MSSSNEILSLENFEETFSLLTQQLESFADVWEANSDPPVLSEFLPADCNCHRYLLTELIKIDLEYRWREKNLPKHLSEYLAEFPELTEDGVPTDLIFEEYHIRKQCGFAVDPEEYIAQFPGQTEELRCLLGINDPYKSTSLYAGGSKQRLSEIQVGDQMEDFDLLAHLGRGAFASVFLARQRSMQRLVALKISVDSSAEPQTLAQLDHDYIVRVFDHRIENESGLRMLYMQYVSGGTLKEVVEGVREVAPTERRGALLLKVIEESLEARGETRAVESSIAEKLKEMSWPEVVCWIGSRLAAGLDYAHRKGVLHRDVKPANVLLTAEGVPKLADFNISFSSKLTGATPAAYFGGSLAYMSPEQLEACNPEDDRQPDSLDGRSDVYSLGVMLWELLTGHSPFGVENIKGNWSKIFDRMTGRRQEGLTEEVLERLPADCPAGLVRVFEGCLAPNRDDRWATGAELSRQFELCLNPRAEAILYPEKSSASYQLRRWIIPVAITSIAIPNILAGVFNYHYNHDHIIQHLQDAQPTFWKTQMVVNSIAYPLGLGILLFMTLPVVRVIRELRTGAAVDVSRLQKARRRSLNLGHITAVIGLVEWTIAGIAYPLCIHLAHGEMPVSAYLHFFGSLILCGLIAASYPFFVTSYFSLRVIYPCLIQGGLTSVDDRELCDQLNRRSWWYLVLALLVPMLGVAALVAMNLDARFSMGVLSIGGTAGAGLMFWLFYQLQTDLEALQSAFELR